MAEFKASARIPCRPLSTENKDLAVAKELLVNYETGVVTICKSDGTFVDMGESVKETIIEQIKEDEDFVKEITIVIDGTNYELQTIIEQNISNVDDLKDALGYYLDDDGNPQFSLLDKIAKIDPDTGKIEFTITTDDIQESDDKQFVTSEEKDKIAKSTHPEVIQVKITAGSVAWTTYQDMYKQQITVDGILESDIPIVDITLGDIYETIQKQLDSYSYIVKILTYDGYIIVYASQPTETDFTIQMKVDR